MKLDSEKMEAVRCSAPVLVSAAAGSGKTTVLTERVIQQIRDGADVSQFLVITFTKDAAAQLKSRILYALGAEVEEAAAAGDQDRARRLRRQEDLLYGADIGTIHSFCEKLVRQYAQLVDISPSFGVLDEKKSTVLLDEAAEAALDDAYARFEQNPDADPDFSCLIESLTYTGDDSKLKKILLDTNRKIQSQPDPKQWLEQAAAGMESVQDPAETPWGKVILEEVRDESRYQQGQCAEAADRTDGDPKLGKYSELFRDRSRFFSRIADSIDNGYSWDEIWECVTAEDFVELNGLGNATSKFASGIKDASKKALDSIKNLMGGSARAVLPGIAGTQPALRALKDLILATEEKYASRKRRMDACDFADLEHFCLTILKGNQTIARTVSAKYKEVLVDEYQDVNNTQDQIVQLVSENGAHLFIVGDKKQSIYRFRQAEPAIFTKKYEEFQAEPGKHMVTLTTNYRSSPGIVDACNAVFDHIMSETLGGTQYYQNPKEHLRFGARFLENCQVRPELRIVDESRETKEENTPEGAAAKSGSTPEAEYVAGRIRSLIDSDEMLFDRPRQEGQEPSQRPVRYSDIAILMRAPKSGAAAFVKALQDRQIPVIAENGRGFVDQPEIRFAMAMLSVIDNPRQDIPLISTMLSVPFSFTPNELAEIHTAGHFVFWDNVLEKAQTDPAGKIADFVGLIQDLRKLAQEESIASLLRIIIARTGLENALAVMPEAAGWQTNLRKLCALAQDFDVQGEHSLHRFTEMLQTQAENNELPAAGAEADAVHLMSIHKAKGLQFPIVFLVDTSRLWKSETDDIQCHTGLGLGMALTDAKAGLRWSTLPLRAVEMVNKKEDLSEQIRLLYVAMTRAEQRLIITCSQKMKESNDTLQQQIQDYAETGPLDPRAMLVKNSAAPWLIEAAKRDRGKHIDLSIAEMKTELEEASSQAKDPAADAEADKLVSSQLEQRLSWVYPNWRATKIPAKITATSIRDIRGFDEPETYAELPKTAETSSFYRLRRPAFTHSPDQATSAEQGTAFHKTMQRIDLTQVGSMEEIDAELDRMEQSGQLTASERQIVRAEDIFRFFTSDLGQRILSADHVEREFEFSLLQEAQMYWPTVDTGNQVLLQGVVDCCFIEGDSISLVDYKTDRDIKPEHYQEQIQAYANAVQRIFGLKVKTATLWYVRHGVGVDVSSRSE